MSIWMWIGVVVVGLVGLLAALAFLVRRSARRDERELIDDPSYLQRLLDRGDIATVVRKLHSQSDKVSAEAARVVAACPDPSVTPALLSNYFYSWRADKAPYVEVLAKRSGEEVVKLVIDRRGFQKNVDAINLLRRFDVPAAREAVDAYDSARARAEADRAYAEAAADKRRNIVERLLANCADRTSLRFPLPIETGNQVAVGKLISGMFSGGVDAVMPNKFWLADLVKLPSECAFCGCSAGKEERWASSNFMLASAGWAMTGVNIQGEAVLPYKVCADCSAHDEMAKSIHIVVELDDQGSPSLLVEVLNPVIALRIQELNPQEDMVLR